METVKDEGSPSSSGLTMMGSKEPLLYISSQRLEWEGQRDRGNEREVILVVDEFLAWKLGLVGLF